jgi:hypothetical protein
LFPPKDAFKGYDVDGDGFISRAELYNMFKAYFYLSQEAVRDALRGAEKEYLKNWDEESADPISKAFASVQTNYSNQPVRLFITNAGYACELC